jgi:NitT/TauT family transport system substrate-binding protein
MRRRELVCAALAALVPCAAAAQPPPEGLRVVGPVAEDETNLYYAIKNGAYRRAGIEVEMVPISSGAAGTAAVIAGSYEIGRTSILAVLSAHLRGIPIKIVAPSIVNSERNPFAMLQMPVDASYASGADLNGKTIGTPALGDLNMLATRCWVDKTGGDSRTLKFVEVPNTALVAAITSRRIDAAILQSPIFDASVAAGTTKTLAYAYGAIAPLFMGAAYVARADWATQHADLLRRFVRVLVDAAAYVNAHPAETAPLVAELTKIELANTEKMHRTQNGTSLDPALIQPVIDAAAKYGIISRAFPARELLWS